eukprot:CAMPEP_0194519120 /NCGR_PEP_ID=MMETSP0253-20130528/52697_1 /TAXON_ID=2966 /ORGANISM="Noctiluca scintillans" /LENGTH=116 /DNA_ID=CAMNT_0039363217 /DNA_START=46 /DNA_END=393 /DNA_ORIENTATION=-
MTSHCGLDDHCALWLFLPRAMLAILAVLGVKYLGHSPATFVFQIHVCAVFNQKKASALHGEILFQILKVIFGAVTMGRNAIIAVLVAESRRCPTRVHNLLHASWYRIDGQMQRCLA